MKIIRVLSEGEIALLPDSALISGGRPVFLPAAACRWQGNLHVAYRVSRLGKNISCRFAHRYIDAFAPVVIATPDTAGMLSPGLAACVDGSVALGKWLPIDEGNCIFEFRGGEYPFFRERSGIERAISTISSVATLKNGDIIIADPLPMAVFPLTIDSSVEVRVSGEVVMAYNVK